MAPPTRRHGPLTTGGGYRVDRETGRAIALCRRLGQRLVWAMRRLEALDGEAAALLRGESPADAKGAKITGPGDVGAAGLPSPEWVETFKEYNRALQGYLGERRRFLQAMRGKESPADVANDSEAIVTALMLATPEERLEAERRMIAQAKAGDPEPVKR